MYRVFHCVHIYILCSFFSCLTLFSYIDQSFHLNFYQLFYSYACFFFNLIFKAHFCECVCVCVWICLHKIGIQQIFFFLDSTCGFHSSTISYYTTRIHQRKFSSFISKLEIKLPPIRVKAGKIMCVHAKVNRCIVSSFFFLHSHWEWFFKR